MKITFFTLPTPPIGMSVGEANGYAIIPKGHPMHGKNYDDIPVDIHGGLTFSAPADKLDWPEIPATQKDGWVVGFDTCHFMDTPERWPTSAVLDEAKNLAEQLDNLA